MDRIVATFCVLLCGLGAESANSQPRDEIVAFVILGVMAGDRFDFPLKGQAATVRSIARNGKFIDAAIEGDKSYVIHIEEAPQCVFEIFMDPGKDRLKIDFTRAQKLAARKLMFTTALALEGENVETDQGKSSDYATLGVLRLGDWDGVNERHRHAAEEMTTRYCPIKAK
jgi:hypothetical protein